MYMCKLDILLYVPSIPCSVEDLHSFYNDIFHTVRLRIQTKILNVRLGKQLSKRYGNAKNFEFEKRETNVA